MLNPQQPTQTHLEFVTLEELVPQDHLLRKVDQVIDFSFIHDLVKDLYCSNNGRPALDPTVLFKMLILGYLMGIRSERQLIKEIEVNVAYRWFLHFGLTDKIPDASTISQNRRRRFQDSTVYQEIFDQIVLQAIQKGLVKGEVLYTDSTHLKASANKNKHRRALVKVSVQGYLSELDQAVKEDRHAHGKKSLKPKATTECELKEIKQSTTDSDSGYMTREGKPQGFFYLDHRTCDKQANIITDVHVTSAAIHDSVPYLERLERQTKRFGFEVHSVGLDAGYMSAHICHSLEQQNIYSVIGYRRPTHRKGYFYKRQFHYDSEKDHYVCPMDQVLSYKTTSREGYRHYQSNPKQCLSCEKRSQCTQNAKAIKTLTRHVWEEAKEAVDQHRLTEYGKKIYARRKETVERSFADAKQLHGYRYARFRGLEKVKSQCLLTAAAQNIKKLALLCA